MEFFREHIAKLYKTQNSSKRQLASKYRVKHIYNGHKHTPVSVANEKEPNKQKASKNVRMQSDEMKQKRKLKTER